MKKLFFTVCVLLIAKMGISQTTHDLFYSNDIKISWLGVDYSHVKLIGDFSQIYGAGEKSSSQIKDVYFVAWNDLILDEREKYDIKGMLNREEIFYDVDMISKINSETETDDLESLNIPHYTDKDIEGFVSTYPVEGKTGIGVLFLAECLNKSSQIAYYHFVALDMQTGKIIFQERLQGTPSGFGLRNYWAGSIYNVIKDIDRKKYKQWKKEN